MNETIDYYRYFDATVQAEFLYDCVQDTLINIIPQEIDYFTKFDEFKNYINEEFEMPDNLISLLVRFLEHGHGTLSKRTLKKEFNALKAAEVGEIERRFSAIFLGVMS